jgi:hypothetical protein
MSALALCALTFGGSGQSFHYFPFLIFKLMPTLHSAFATARTAVVNIHFETPSSET